MARNWGACKWILEQIHNHAHAQARIVERDWVVTKGKHLGVDIEVQPLRCGDPESDLLKVGITAVFIPRRDLAGVGVSEGRHRPEVKRVVKAVLEDWVDVGLAFHLILTAILGSFIEGIDVAVERQS